MHAQLYLTQTVSKGDWLPPLRQYGGPECKVTPASDIPARCGQGRQAGALMLLMDGNEVTGYVARTVDGELEIRSSRDESPQYPAARWARDQQALGSQVQRRRIIVLDDWRTRPRR